MAALVFVGAFVVTAFVSIYDGSRHAPSRLSDKTYQGEDNRGNKIYCDRIGNCERE